MALLSKSLTLKTAIKKMVFISSYFCVLPLISVTWLEEICSKRQAVFSFCTHLLSLMPGLPGTYLRGAYYYGTLRKCAWDFHMSFGSFCAHRDTEIGAGVAIGAYCIIGTATIGPGTIIASRCSIPSGKMQHIDSDGELTRVFSAGRVHIGKNVWIGEGAVIMDDVGDNTIIGAGSVLTQKAPPRCLMTGVPARRRKSVMAVL